ncbi:hypothetical protein CFS9_37340 [Flavobacterium sp. CFS9]|uniref:Uncharacterized protein n=1 Tax=Flavobacterium sp. CFS9 TaxID=3143118 RepID=A0AAT9H6E0_9FLAO|nr:hypothetical protein DBR27_14075 [Flavobacterium sp. HMWF030]
MQCPKNELNLIEKQKQKEENKHAVHQFSAVSFSKLLFSLFIFFNKPFDAFDVYWVRFHKIVYSNLSRMKKTKALKRAD